MIFTPTPLAGAFVIDPELREDHRGCFARTWCQKDFEAQGLTTRLVQCNTSVNPKKGTWRGLHFQGAPHGETKLIRCTMGSIWDVVVDLRPESPTFTQHFAATLSAENRKMLYVPERFAHGFLTLQDNTEVFYQMSEFHEPSSARIPLERPILRHLLAHGSRHYFRT